MNVTNYFDLEEVLVYELVGSVWIFVFLGIILIWYASIKAKLNFEIPLIATVLFSGICFSIAYNELLILWLLAIMFAGFTFYYGLSNIINK